MAACTRVYIPRDPQNGVLVPLVRAHWPAYLEAMEGACQSVPGFVRKAIERLLDCGDPEKGFIRLRCPDCQVERALAFSCKGRGLCPSCGARRMHDTAEHLVERVLPEVAIRQYVLSPPSELVGLLAARGEALSALGRIFIDSIFRGIRSRNASGNLHCGAVVFVKPFTKALGVYPHFHALVLDGGYLEEDGGLAFVADLGPREDDLLALTSRVGHRFEK